MSISIEKQDKQLHVIGKYIVIIDCLIMFIKKKVFKVTTPHADTEDKSVHGW